MNVTQLEATGGDSEDKPSFGFFKRPTRATLIETEEVR